MILCFSSTVAIAVTLRQLDKIARAPPEDEEVAGVRVLGERGLHVRCLCVHAAVHDAAFSVIAVQPLMERRIFVAIAQRTFRQPTS